MLSRDEITSILKETGVLKEGHFILTSGRHSDQYMQMAQVLQYADETEKLCKSLAEGFSEENVHTVLYILRSRTLSINRSDRGDGTSCYPNAQQQYFSNF